MSEITIGSALVVAVMGYAVVFFGLVLLMIVITVMGRLMAAKTAPKEETVATSVTRVEEPKKAAPGTAGEIKLYDTDPKDAAMIMAIVADSLGKPINELRFISIREVKEQ